MHQSIMIFALLKSGSGENRSPLDRYFFFLIRMRSGKEPPSARRTILPVFQWRNDLTNMIVYSPSLIGEIFMLVLSFVRGRCSGRTVVVATVLPIGTPMVVSAKAEINDANSLKIKGGGRMRGMALTSLLTGTCENIILILPHALRRAGTLTRTTHARI